MSSLVTVWPITTTWYHVSQLLASHWDILRSGFKRKGLMTKDASSGVSVRHFPEVSNKKSYRYVIIQQSRMSKAHGKAVKYEIHRYSEDIWKMCFAFYWCMNMIWRLHTYTNMYLLLELSDIWAASVYWSLNRKSDMIVAPSQAFKRCFTDYFHKSLSVKPKWIKHKMTPSERVDGVVPTGYAMLKSL